MIIDAKTGKRVYEMPAGVMGQMSYLRLIRTLTAIGEIKDDEKITHLRLTDDFIIYRVERR